MIRFYRNLGQSFFTILAFTFMLFNQNVQAKLICTKGLKYKTIKHPKDQNRIMRDMCRF